MLASGEPIRSHPLYLPALVLVLLGALTKSAQFPFHFWLPQAMAAPTPVSAYLHSATMVKAGVFLLARLWPVLAGTDAWFWIVGGAGLVTLLLGAYVAIFQQDLKGLLAYSTISHLGLITLLLGLDSAAGAGRGDLPHHEPRDLQGVAVHGGRHHRPRDRHARHPAPERAAAASCRSPRRWRWSPRAAMAGVPLLNGFLSKEMFFAETDRRRTPSPFVDDALPLRRHAGRRVRASPIRCASSTACSSAAARRTCRATPHEPPRWMRFPVELLVLACLVVGIVPGA